MDPGIKQYQGNQNECTGGHATLYHVCGSTHSPTPPQCVGEGGDPMIRRREFITLLGGAAVGWPLAARAQQSGGLREVGFLISGSTRDIPLVTDAFRQGLKESNYVEGRNVAFEYDIVE